jgi:hypothetical protein
LEASSETIGRAHGRAKWGSQSARLSTVFKVREFERSLARHEEKVMIVR